MLALEDMVKLADQGEDLVIRLRLTLRIPVDESVGSLVHLQGGRGDVFSLAWRRNGVSRSHPRRAR